MSQALYSCEHCKKSFVMERAFMIHRCEQMDRVELMRTAIGQSAYAYYCAWMTKGRRKAPPADTFRTSTYFRSFIKFAEFIRKVSIPNPDKYIDIMVEKQISPILWCRNECYSMYLEWNDRLSSPYDQAQITIETIMKIAEVANITPSEVFQKLEPGEIIQLVVERKLSPWILLVSKAFKDKLVTMDVNQHTTLMRLIGIDHWAFKMEENREVIADMKLLVKELGI